MGWGVSSNSPQFVFEFVRIHVTEKLLFLTGSMQVSGLDTPPQSFLTALFLPEFSGILLFLQPMSRWRASELRDGSKNRPP